MATIVITTPIPQKDITLFPETTVEVLKQIHKVNCDGSYSFGFKASDGTFLVERKDADGYVTGEFGYTKQQLQLSGTFLFKLVNLVSKFHFFPRITLCNLTNVPFIF